MRHYIGLAMILVPLVALILLFIFILGWPLNAFYIAVIIWIVIAHWFLES